MSLRWTPQFKILGVLGLFMLWASINYSNNGAYFVLFLLVSTVVTSGFMAWSNLKYVEMDCDTVAEGTAGADLLLPVRIRNSGRRQIEALRMDLPGFEILESSADVGMVAANDTLSQRICLPLKVRGKFRINELIVESDYPLGFWRCRKRVPVSVEVWVYPKPEGGLPWPEEVEVDDDHADELGSHSGDHFAGHRDYVEGESQRHVDWRAFSRGKGLLIKDYRGGGSGCAVFDYQHVPSRGVEQRVSQLAEWVGQAFLDDADFALALPGHQIGPARGRNHQRTCLRALAEFEPGGAKT